VLGKFESDENFTASLELDFFQSGLWMW